MTKEEFLEDKYIKCFIKWFIEKLTSGFSHSYNTKKPKKEYNFKSIYEAYEKYEWNGKNLDENNKELKQWSDLLTKSSCNFFFIFKLYISPVTFIPPKMVFNR